MHVPRNEHKQVNLFSTYWNILFFHKYRKVIFYLMLAYNKCLKEHLLAYFLSVNGKNLFIYGSFNCATTETTQQQMTE